MKKHIHHPSFGEIFLFPIFFPLLLIFGVVPENKNLYIMFSVLLMVAIIIAVRLQGNKWKWEDLGVTSKNLNAKSILFFLAMSLIYVLVFVILYHDKPKTYIRLEAVLFSLLYSFGQEFLYRGYLLKVTDVVLKNKMLSNTVNVILFTAMHLFFKLNPFDYLMIAVSGVGFLVLYRKYPNLLLVGLLHFMTNLMAINIGMFKPHLHF